MIYVKTNKWYFHIELLSPLTSPHSSLATRAKSRNRILHFSKKQLTAKWKCAILKQLQNELYEDSKDPKIENRPSPPNRTWTQADPSIPSSRQASERPL